MVLPDLSPGTHTLRVFASRPWHESFKNEGAYAETTFHVFTKTDDNNPDPKLPLLTLLTYSRPQSSYGAEPILLDFYLTNAPLHLVEKENANDGFSDWRIRVTINGESFIFDRWQAVYLKGFQTGKNWVKLEFLDNQGNPLKNTFNTTVRLIDFQPKSKDTLSKIVRGELTADEVRPIVDPNYRLAPKPTPTPSVEKTPQVQPKLEKQTIPESEISKESKTQPEQPKLEIPKVVPSPTLSPTPPEIIESPIPEPQSEVTPTPESTPLPEKVVPRPTKPKFGGFFNRKAGKAPTPQVPVETSPSVPPTLPEIIESPAPKTITPTPEPQPEPPTLPEIIESPVPKTITPTPEPQPEVTPTPESTPLPEKVTPQTTKSKFGGFFNRKAGKIPTPEASVEPSPSVPPTLPEIIEPPAPEIITPPADTKPESQPEVTPTPPSAEFPEKPVQQP